MTTPSVARASRAITVAACTALVLVVAASGAEAAATGRPTPAKTRRPAGPVPTVAVMHGGKGVFIGEGTAPVIVKAGYVQREYSLSGTATEYALQGTQTPDGRWAFVAGPTAPYKTRMIVRAPKNKSKFSGNVIVEWLNVSGGVDADPEWVMTDREIERSGDVWVGVSAQRIGVEGGPVIVKVENIPGAEAAGKGLKAIDPTRYGSLVHPGDGYAFDIYTQAARALRAGKGLAGLKPKRLIAAGESQSAFALVTYYNGVQPLTKEFDGFFVHSRGGVSLPLVGADQYADLAGALGSKRTTIMRTDLAAPVMDIQSETDVESILSSYAARQPDTKNFRLWEMAGTSHADTTLVGPNAGAMNCGVPINDGPMNVIAKAAMHDLKSWVAGGKQPAKAPRLDVEANPSPVVQRDGDGIALGGVRTPPVDVPVSVLSGKAGPNPSTICLLLGSDQPLPAARIAALYSSRADYLAKFQKATDAAIKAGFVLRADRTAMLSDAKPDQVPGS